MIGARKYRKDLAIKIFIQNAEWRDPGSRPARGTSGVSGIVAYGHLLQRASPLRPNRERRLPRYSPKHRLDRLNDCDSFSAASVWPTVPQTRATISSHRAAAPLLHEQHGVDRPVEFRVVGDLGVLAPDDLQGE